MLLAIFGVLMAIYSEVSVKNEPVSSGYLDAV